MIDDLFNYSEVMFDEDNIIKKIDMNYHQKKGGKTAIEVFNFMSQYFCQRYQGMKTITIDEVLKKEYAGEIITYSQEGMTNIWETNKIRIALTFYSNTLIDYKINYPSYDGQVVYNWTANYAENELRGNFVKLNIIAK